jgi:hypothetical protein
LTIQKQRARLKHKFSAEEIDLLSQEFNAFLRAYQEEALFKEALLYSFNEKKGFSDSWAVANGWFPLLQKFCGGLASAFPNMASVESDFSIINWEKDTS